MNFEKKLDQIFSGTQTLISILLGVFTLALMQAITFEGVYPQVKGWYALFITTGSSIILSTVLCIICFFTNGQNISPCRKKFVISLFVLILVICGVGTPVSGLIIFMTM